MSITIKLNKYVKAFINLDEITSTFQNVEFAYTTDFQNLSPKEKERWMKPCKEFWEIVTIKNN